MIDELKGKKLLVLGGNPYADVISVFCKKNDIKIYSMSNDADAAIHKVAFKSFISSSAEPASVLKIIEKEHIDGVYMGGNETVIGKVCQTINDLGLPCYCNKKQWELFQNKGKFKKLCKEFGLPVLERYNYKPSERCKIDFPVITKPADACGSSGFSICRNFDELDKGYEFAKLNSLSGEVIVEKYVKNEGHVVFYSFSNGQPYFCLLQDKYPFKFKTDGSFVAGAHVFKSDYTDEFKILFGKKLDKLFRSIKLKEGTLWIEVFHDGNNYYFNEAGYRYGGSISIYPIDYFEHINQVASDIYYSLTGESKLFGFDTIIPNKVLKNKKYYCMYPIYLKPGTIDVINGFDVLETSSFIVKNIIKWKPGHFVNDTGDFSHNFGYIHFVYDNRKEFNEIISLIHKNIMINDTNGKNMIIKHKDNFFERIRIE